MPLVPEFRKTRAFRKAQHIGIFGFYWVYCGFFGLAVRCYQINIEWKNVKEPM